MHRPHALHHGVKTQLSRGESVVPHAKVCVEKRCFDADFHFHNVKLLNRSCGLFFPQIVSTNRECMLMERFLLLLGVDPACSAGVRQVCAMHSERGLQM